MKLIGVIKKSYKEQMRQFWLLLLTVSMAPFFILIYYLFIESSKPSYDLILVNQDKGVQILSNYINHGEILTKLAKQTEQDSLNFPLTVGTMDNLAHAENRVKNNKADALLVIPEDFSYHIQRLSQSNNKPIEIEFIGDITNFNYIITVIWAHEVINDYISNTTGKTSPLKVKETALGSSTHIDDFNNIVPGLLILSIIMLMLTASIALVTEVEQKTIIRLKLSKLKATEFLTGVSAVQVAIGFISILLTLLVAVGLGFRYSGSFLLLLFIALITSISIIGFSLILAAVTKTVNEVLIVGNFPLFLFMFFTGAAFSIESPVLFTVSGYTITLTGLMSPTQAVSALRKIMIMNMGSQDILPEIITLIVLTCLYFLIGVWSFQKRHMRVE